MKPPSVVIVTAGHEGEVANMNPLQHKRIFPFLGARGLLEKQRVQKQEIFRLLWHPNVYYRVRKSTPLNTILSRFNQFVPSSIISVVSVKGKAIPLQAWTGPEGSRRLRLPDFKTIGA
jgi:hypothetical protein